MNPRLVWFAAGSAAGLYASFKAKRAAYRLTPSGLVDQASALGVGWRAFSAEVQEGMDAREQRIAQDLELPLELRTKEHH
ncbi:MAG: DUF6167 family protein [Actinomycetota bacterium]|nr:DUF6167 family protein [Actinomycetota bacterium]